MAFSQVVPLIVEYDLFNGPALEHSALRYSLIAGTWLTHSNGYLLFACDYFVDNFHSVTHSFKICQDVSKITQEIKKNLSLSATRVYAGSSFSIATTDNVLD